MSRPGPAAEEDLDRVEEAFGYRFDERGLLETALTHASWANERAGAASNERLEFLGDAVLGLVAGHLLFEAHPDWREGELTRALHALVDRRALAARARALRLGEGLRLGRSEHGSAGAGRDTILADALEAVIGAVYLDGGLEPVRAWARRAYASALAPDAPRPERDPKTRFQEHVMERFGTFPRYEVVSDSGVEDDARRFTVRVLVEGDAWGEGVGRSKRAAERAAAQVALEREPA